MRLTQYTATYPVQIEGLMSTSSFLVGNGYVTGLEATPMGIVASFHIPGRPKPLPDRFDVLLGHNGYGYLVKDAAGEQPEQFKKGNR